MNIKFKDFEIASFSDLDYEEMTVEIRYRGIPIAQINKDKGFECCDIEIPYRFSPGDEKFIFPLDDFMEVLGAAKAMLGKLG